MSLTSIFCTLQAHVFSHGPDAKHDELRVNECACYFSADGRGGQRQQVCSGAEAMQSKCLVSVSHKDESTRPEKPPRPFSNVKSVCLCVCGTLKYWNAAQSPLYYSPILVLKANIRLYTLHFFWTKINSQPLNLIQAAEQIWCLWNADVTLPVCAYERVVNSGRLACDKQFCLH